MKIETLPFGMKIGNVAFPVKSCKWNDAKKSYDVTLLLSARSAGFLSYGKVKYRVEWNT